MLDGGSTAIELPRVLACLSPRRDDLMADERGHGVQGRDGQVSGALLERLRSVLAVYSGSQSDDEVSPALRAIGVEARSAGIKAEQLVASLKRVFDSLTPPPTLASSAERSARLSHLVTICVREYYASMSAAHSGDTGTTT
jgi:hypothetical protein